MSDNEIANKIDTILSKSSSKSSYEVDPDGNKVTVEKPFGMIRNAWDKKDLEEVGLMTFIDDANEVFYEIKNGMRGTSGVIGMETPSLAAKLHDMSIDLEKISGKLLDAYNTSVGIVSVPEEKGEGSYDVDEDGNDF